MTQSKDFLALAHGQEWVSFYESFDKLVQDNLSRSSELLRRAMALPEVADREVQQIRTEMEQKLAEERQRQRDLLTSMSEDLASSYRQVSMLARSVGTVIGDLDRLTQRLHDAIAAFDLAAPASAEPELPVAVPVTAVRPNGTESVPAAPAHTAPEPVATPPAAFAEPVTQAEPDGTSAPTDEAGSPNAMDEIAQAMQEQDALLDAAEQKLDELEAAIDLSSQAETEVKPAAEAGAPADAVAVAAPAVEAEPGAESRSRPHWLSVTRNASRQ